MQFRHLLLLVALFLLSTSAEAQTAAPIPCDGDADTPSFLSAANDVYYGCGYLVKSTPPQYAMAANYFRDAIRKEPENAAALYFLGITEAGQGRADAARESFAAATRIDPTIAERVGTLIARQPALPALVERTLSPAANAPAPAAAQAARPAPTPAARTDAPAAARAFAVGARVEVQYSAGNWIPGVVTAADPGACPYYRVEHDAYGNGSKATLGYFCGSVRAPTGVAQPRPSCGGSNPNCPPTSPPPLGNYTCDQVTWDVAAGRARNEYKGYVALLAGGRYRWLDDGGTGTYRYDSATRRVRWLTGPLVAQGGVAEYGLDGTTPEITITFETAYTRQTGNEPPRWQCGLSR